MRRFLFFLTLLAACVLLPILLAQLISRVAPVGGVELAMLYVVVLGAAVFVWHKVRKSWSKA